MIFERVQNYIKGYVSFRATGGFPERFINLSSVNNVEIRNVKMYKETITALCDIKEYRRIRHVGKKSGMKVRLLKKYGLPFLLYKKRKRVGVLFGFAFFVVMTYFLSGFIWSVNVKGNEKIPAEDILMCYSSIGVKPGIKKGSIDTKETARKALSQMDGLMWTAVNINGCRVTIEVKERDIHSVEEEDDTPSNIIAKKSGQIKVIENFLGTPVADVGSAVEKGDIIVSGAVINRDESVNFYKAEANVIARTKNRVSAGIFSNCNMRVYDRVKKKYVFSFFGVSVPFGLPFKNEKQFSFSQGEDFLVTDGNKLPVGVVTKRYAFYDKMTVKLKPSAMKLMCAEKYFRNIDETFNNVAVEKSMTKRKNGSDFYSLETVFECVENISESEKMDIRLDENNFQTN